MENMRRTLLQHTPLRMANGGGFAQKFRETVFGAPKGYVPATAAAAPAAAPAPAPAPQKAITDYAGGSATERRMKAAGLRDGGDLRTGHGGHVPGKGQGDKIDALYEPGEFVVSNDMLDAAPELREQLTGLRGQVLAAKGMTPEQADAKALGRGSLRAANGFPGDWAKPQQPWNSGTPTAAVSSVSGPEQYKNTAVGPNGSAQAQAYRTPPAAAPVAPAATPSRVQRAVGSLQSGASTAAGGALRLAGGAGLGYGAADAVIGAFENNEGAPADKARREASVSQIPLQDGSVAAYDEPRPFTAGERFVRGAEEFAGKTLPALPGIAATMPLAGAANSLRTAGAAAAAVPSRLAVGGFAAGAGARAVQELAGSDAAPNAPAPADAAPAAAPAAAPGGLPAGTTKLRDGIYETRLPGKSVEFGDEASLTDVGFRNRGAISAQNMGAADALDARGASERAGLRQREQYNAEVANAQRINANTQAQSLRGGLFDTPRARRADRELDIRETDGIRGDETARRGQDLTFASASRGQDITARNQATTQANADRAYKLDVQKFGVETANKYRDDKRAAETSFDNRLLGFAGVDKDGKPDARTASQLRIGANAMLDREIKKANELLAREPGNRTALAAIENIRRMGVGAIDDDQLRTLLNGVQANKAIREDDNWSPFSSKSTNTSSVPTELTLEDNMFLPNRYVTNNGQKASRSVVESNPDFAGMIAPPKAKPLRQQP